MKLKIEKLGRIRSAEIDVRPLTVLIGPNNTNKTWTAYVLYGLLQFFSRKLTGIRFVDAPAGIEGTDVSLARLKEALQPFYEALKADPAPERLEYKISISQEGSEPRLYGPIKDSESLHHLLGLTHQRIPDASASLDASASELATSIVSLDLVFERFLNRLQIKTNRRRRLEAGKTEDSSTITTHFNEDWNDQKIFDVVHQQTWNIIEHVVVFPAERNGLLPVWPLFSGPEKIEVPYPVIDFVRFLGIAQTVPASPMNSSQIHLSTLLKKVLGGEIAYTSEEGRKRLVFRTGGTEVPLHAAASLSRAVAGLSIYIERFFRPDDVLIIDELEMNAHPQAQVALTEFIAALVNAGVRVVLTTHSPYVVDHLNNLMEASRTPAERREDLARRFALETPSSFISPEKVSVYAFQEESPEGEVTVREVLNRETGLIDWSTFSRVSEHITNLYSDILRATEEDS